MQTITEFMFRAPNAEALRNMFRFCPETCSLAAGFQLRWSAEILQWGCEDRESTLMARVARFEAINPEPTLPYTKCSLKAEWALHGRVEEDEPTDEETEKGLTQNKQQINLDLHFYNNWHTTKTNRCILAAKVQRCSCINVLNTLLSQSFKGYFNQPGVIN